MAAGLRTFRALLFAHALVRVCSWAPNGLVPLLSYAFAIALSVICLLAWTGRERWACRAAAALMFLEQVSAFPGTANHVYLEYLLFLLFAFLDPDDERERALLITSLRWITIVVLFYTGVQKVLLGYYFGGEFLLFAISARDTFAEFFALLLPAAEVERLTEEQTLLPGAGPFRTDWLPFLLAANLVWIAEIGLPAGMMIRRTRNAAVIASVALVLSLQLAAREYMFALLFSHCLLLVPLGTWNRRFAWVYVAAYVFLFGFVIGLVPARFLLGGGVW